MSYPVLPMALVTFLAAASKERSTLPKGPTHVTTVVHHGEATRSSRFAVEVDAHWNEVVEQTIRMHTSGETDTITVIYPSNGDDPVDFGVILEGGRKPFCFQWTYAPAFDVRLAHPDVIAQITKGVGIETFQGLLDRDYRQRTPGSAILASGPAVNDRYFAGTGDPQVAGSGAA